MNLDLIELHGRSEFDQIVRHSAHAAELTEEGLLRRLRYSSVVEPDSAERLSAIRIRRLQACPVACRFFPYVDVPERSLRPSRWWLAIGLTCFALATASVIGAWMVQRGATQPIGEGEVFSRDAEIAGSLVSDSETPNAAAKHARNELMIEAVSIVDREATVVATSSKTLRGSTIDNPVLEFGASTGRFVAVAGAVDDPIEVAGVEEWPSGAVLYQVVSPLDEESSLLLHYDVAELLERRVQPGDVQPETIQLLVLGAVFALLGLAVGVAQSRAAQRAREAELESNFLREHSESLEVAKKEAEDALALAEEKIRIRSEFVLMINHELRTPLTAVVTGAEMLRDDDLPKRDREEVVKAMVADGSRLQEIIDQILAVARIENRGLNYVLDEVPLTEVCGAAVNSHQAALDTYVPHEHDASAVVTTDLKTLNLVVGSLVDNAVTHGAGRVVVGCTLDPSLTPLVEVGTRPEDAAYVTVADNGPGIDPEFLPRVFEKFEKASRSSGTGLGLYMARLMVEALGGSLGVNSSPVGSVFTIALPLATTRELEPV